METRAHLISHLFGPEQEILTPTWRDTCRPIPEFDRLLKVSVLGPLDLILTKLGRGDEKDFEDIDYLICNVMEDPSPTYRRDAVSPVERFDDVETTISHLFRRPHPALGGRSYGEALYQALRAKGLLEAPEVHELGGGAGFVAAAMSSMATREGRPLRYTFLELSRTLLSAQRTQLPSATAIAAHAERLPLRNGVVRGLFLANEVIADLRVSPADAPESAELARRYGLSLDGARRLNTGAIRFVEELARVLARGASACLVEFGGDFEASPVALSGAFGRALHVEHSIHFGHLEAAAKALGFKTERVAMADLLQIDRSMRVTSYPDVVRLRNFAPSLPVLAHPMEEIARAHPFLLRVFQLEFPPIGSPRFPDPQATAGFCQLFHALMLRK